MEESSALIPMSVPCKPSQEEVDNHNISHYPFRSWCKHCVMGKAVSGYHKTSKDKCTKPVISRDYMYLRSRTEEESKENINEDMGMDEEALGMPT